MTRPTGTASTARLIRHDGWTPTEPARLLRELGATHSVTAAAQAVGMSR